MKFDFKNLVLPLVVAALFVTACANKEITEKEAEYIPEVTTQVMEPGLTQTFTATGEVFAHQISRITAERRAKVETILLKEGDSVNAGQTLITLSSPEANSTFNTASSTLRNAQVGLGETRLSAQKSVESAQLVLETAQTTLQNTLAQNRALKVQAKETLNAAMLNTELSVASANTTFNNAIKDALPAVLGAFTTSDKIVGISPVYKYSNDSFENNLGALNSQSKQDAEIAITELQSLISIYSESYDNALILLLAAEEALQKTVILLSYSIPGANYPEATLAADSSAMTAQLTAIRARITALQAAQNALYLAEQNSNGDSQADLTAEAVYKATLAQLNANENVARKAVESAQKTVEGAAQSAELSNLSAQSSLNTAFGTFDQARISRDKLFIKAPFKGHVSQLDVKVGQEVNPGAPLVTIENSTLLVIRVYLSSVDVQKVSVGDPVMINQSEPAFITSIAPSAEPITKKYKVEINHSNTNLRPGELAKVSFETTEQIYDGNRLFVPLPALHILPTELFVWRIENRKTVKSIVETGEIVGDFVEVVSGLSAGDEIIIIGGRLIEDEEVKVDILNRVNPKLPIAE